MTDPLLWYTGGILGLAWLVAGVHWWVAKRKPYRGKRGVQWERFP